MKRGIVNVRMVITEEKILSNIEKVNKLINPNSKKQIIELEDNSYFRDLIESIKTYLIEYPRKKNFPKDVYEASFKLVEYATEQFEDNTKQIEKLIKEREYNIKSAAILKQTLEVVQSGDKNWKQSVKAIQSRFSKDVIQSLSLVATAKEKDPQNYDAALKLINARITNLQTNLHIEIDMERIEDRSKALSFIGIEIANALKQIPAPKAEVATEEVKEVVQEEPTVEENVQVAEEVKEEPKVVAKEVKVEEVKAPVQQVAQVQQQQQQAQQQVNNTAQMLIQNQAQQNQYLYRQQQYQQQLQMQRQAYYNNLYAQQYAQYQQRVMPQQMQYAQGMQQQGQYYNPRQMQQVKQPEQNNLVQARQEKVEQVDYSDRIQQNANMIKERREKKAQSSIWNKFKNSKFVKTLKYALKIRVVLQLPEGDTAEVTDVTKD